VEVPIECSAPPIELATMFLVCAVGETLERSELPPPPLQAAKVTTAAQTKSRDMVRFV
jgi:hypothetical protein